MRKRISVKLDKKRTMIKTKKKLYLALKASRQKNPEKQKAYQKAYWEKNKEKRKEYKKRERKTPQDKIRRAVHHAFTRIKKDRPTNTLRLLGCSWEEAKSHIENLWQEGMSWENHGQYGWHIDHIRPVSSFREDELHLMNRIENLQPLWWKDNLSKSDKF